MNKHERKQLRKRIDASCRLTMAGWERVIIYPIIEIEIDRAIRAERRAQRIASDARAKWREEAQAQAITAAVERHGTKL
jgi:hypothetical protein